MIRSKTSIVTVFLLCTCVVGLLSSVAMYVGYRDDRLVLRDVAYSVTEGIDEPSERVLALLQWVHDLHGSSQNPAYYLIRRWRATPVQVLNFGGDCADKSRLLYALLGEIGISSSMAMCFDESTMQPTHTVVEARIAANSYMLVDPAYNLFFPDGSGEYYDLLDMRNDRDIVPRRINALLAQRPGSTARDRYYLSATTAYHTASTMNWHRNWLTKFAYSLSRFIYENQVYRVERPYVFERPILAAITMCLFVSVIAGLAALMLWRWQYVKLTAAQAIHHTSATDRHVAVSQASTTAISV